MLVDSNNDRATDLSNTEVQLEMIKEDKTKTDHALGELKNEEALLAIEYSELIEVSYSRLLTINCNHTFLEQ